MSIQAVAWVLDNSESRGFSRLVLLSLANHINGDTGLCCPSMRTIAREAGVSLGTIPNAVTNLVALGELKVLEEGGPRRSARYVLPFAERSGDEHKSVQEPNAARAPGVNAASSPGVNRTVSNRNQPGEASQEVELSERDLEAADAALKSMRARHGFVKRAEDAA